MLFFAFNKFPYYPQLFVIIFISVVFYNGNDEKTRHLYKLNDIRPLNMIYGRFNEIR